jgi:hypothetical protein
VVLAARDYGDDDSKACFDIGPPADEPPPVPLYPATDPNFDGVARSVSLAGFSIGAEGAARIGRALILNTALIALDLSQCDIEDNGAVELFRCLARNSTLKFLNLSGNFLTSKAASAAAAYLRVPTVGLETLYMACNAIDDEGALALSHAVAHNKSLRLLNLRGNQLSPAGVQLLLEYARPEHNYSLVGLWLQFNRGLTPELEAELTALMALKCPPTVKQAAAEAAKAARLKKKREKAEQEAKEKKARR